MAGATLLTLLDDITTMLDDVAAMTKVAAGKTAGVVGDDLALNAKQVMGTPAERELPVVWAVAKGSLVNKLIIVPIAILLATFLPVLINPLLMLGGLFLCYEGAHKILPSHGHSGHSQDVSSLGESEKIKGAIRTDFILSSEIIVISLGVVAAADLQTRVAVLCAIGLGMTVFVYGLVAAIVKLDDAGLHLATKGGLRGAFGRSILVAAPYLMRGLGVLGTAAMFMVGGQILWHGIPPLHHMLEPFAHGIFGVLISGIVGVVCGVLAVYATGLGHFLSRFFKLRR